MKIAVKDLKPGDKTEWYTVTNMILVNDEEVVAQVHFNDGSDARRSWDDPDLTIDVQEETHKMTKHTINRMLAQRDRAGERDPRHPGEDHLGPVRLRRLLGRRQAGHRAQRGASGVPR